MAYDAVRVIHDGNVMLGGRMREGRAFVTAVDSELFLGDGNLFSVVRIRRTPEVYAVLQERVIPVAVATWRARLERGESFKIGQPGGSWVLELKHTELWVPGSSPMRPLMVAFGDARVEGPYLYRSIGGDPVAMHGVLARDLILRALLVSYGVTVT